MTLFRQLFAGVSLLFFVTLAGVVAIHLANSRSQLQEQLGSQAQDAATSLALRFASLKSLENPALVEAFVNPIFDRGYFQEIRVVSAKGDTLLQKNLAPAQGDVPAWFTELYSLRAPGAQSLVSTGWQELGRVIVVSHPNFAYQQLWLTGVQTIAWLLLIYAAGIASAVGFLAMLLRPLREIEDVAVAIGERDFRTIAFVPRARELARVVVAMNAMSGRIRQMIEEESARAEALRRDAFIDPVTSLYNRRGFRRQLQSLIKSKGDIYSGALALVEISNFGDFNTAAGYQRGDEMLALLGGALAKSDEGSMVVCGRLGGAGFAFATINMSEADLQRLVAGVCRRIGNLLAEQAVGAQLHYHCGVTWRAGALPEFSALLASADHALQRARDKGVDQHEVETFDAEAAEGSQAWRALVERSIAEDRIALFAQNVLGIPARLPVHTEITVRMTREQGDAVPAAQFLPMAARHGLIAQLDCRVVEKLLDYLARGSAVATMAVNISARTLADADATGRLLGLLDARSNLAGRLIFEMTEFGAMQDWTLARRFSGEVRRRGARLALDNFGMQQESLMLMHALRPHYIKLSPAYSRELAVNADCHFLVASLVRIAQSLDIEIYAQAVEDESLIPKLAELGIAGYQGYAISRPVQIA